jgi:hypothetical protein
MPELALASSRHSKMILRLPMKISLEELIYIANEDLMPATKNKPTQNSSNFPANTIFVS